MLASRQDPGPTGPSARYAYPATRSERATVIGGCLAMKPGQSELQVLVESLRTISETQELHGKMLVALVHALDGPGTGESELVTVLNDISVALKY
ncbi:hypothetical protein [Acetobacter thailandicus]|uniref:hypothetical protein n=1 Tax=Acetobacter thailandicus TaxID=1502842 RepID=UPI001BAD3AB4|nr:hypothetical protein [Acetobacter thailandicus]MBS0981320.1 hypothetical protein [Acetobacter thailandicus]